MSATNANRVSHFWASQNTLFGSQGTELWEPNIYIWVLSFMYCFTHTVSFQAPTYWNCHLHKRLLTDEVFHWWLVIVFRFLGEGFANISPPFLTSCEVQTRYSKTLKYSEQYVRDHLSSTKVIIWICSEYDAVFNFSISQKDYQTPVPNVENGHSFLLHI